jgi:hypothetical protein
MDILIRGLCEQYIDYRLEEREIREVRDLIDSIELPVSKDDVLLGFFLGAASSQLRNFILAVYNRVPEEAEIEHYRKVLMRRAPEIIARIISLPPVDESGDTPEDYPQIIYDDEEEMGQETEEPIISEIELSPVATLDDSEGSGESMKFSFQSRSVKKPVAAVLGIPVKK